MESESDDLCGRYYQLTGKTVSPAWVHQEVKALIDNLYFWCTLPSKELGKSVVPLKEVIGSTHDSYNNSYKTYKPGSRTWLDMLNSLERYDTNFKDFQGSFKALKDFVENNPDGGKELKYYKFGKEFIISGGNHRTCFGKMLEGDCFVAPVEEYYFDNELYGLYQELRKKGFGIRFSQDIQNAEPDCDYHTEKSVSWTLFFKGLSKEIALFLNNRTQISEFLYKYNQFQPVKWKLALYRAMNKPTNQIEREFDSKSFDRIDEVRMDLMAFKAQMS
jgi:hypothetical protein